MDSSDPPSSDPSPKATQELPAELRFLTSPIREELHRLLKLTNRLLETSFTQLSFITDRGEWFLTSHNEQVDSRESVRTFPPKDIIHQDDFLLVSDLSNRKSIDGNKLVVNGRGFRSFAGAPITTHENFAGVLGVWAEEPHDWTDRDRENLEMISEQIQDSIQHRSSNPSSSEKRFRSIANSTQDYFTVLDDSGQILYGSPSIEDVLGFSPEEILGNSAFDYIHPEDLEEAKRVFATLIDEENNKHRRVECRHRDAKGNWVWLEVYGWPTYKPDWNGYLLSSRDITARKKTEQQREITIEKLRERTLSLNDLDNIISAIPSTVMVVDQNGTIEQVNPMLCDLLNYSPEELHGESPDVVFATDGWSEIQSLMEENNSGILRNREVQYETRNGEQLSILFSASRFENSDTGPHGWVCLGVDISQRKQAREALAESENRFREVAENINEMIFMFSRDWSELLYVNSQYTEIWGRSVESLRENPMDFIEGVHPDDQDVLQRNMERVAAGEAVEGFEYRVIHSDGSQRWILADGKPIRDEDGSVRRIVGIVRDITELKETRQNLQRTLDEKANLLKEVHHRVKNNMQIIKSILNLHERSDHYCPDELLSECRNRIQAIARIHNMLYKSDNLADIPFVEYVERLVSSVTKVHSVPESSLDVTLDVDSSLEVTLSHAVPCGLIIHELVSNAFKHAFTVDGNNRLEIQLRETPENEVSLRVRDNGPGFPESFDPDEGDSLGMEILQALGEYELGGTLRFYEDSMTTVETRFRLDDHK